MIKNQSINCASSDVQQAKQLYNTPVLQIFGQVSTLTLGQSTCGDKDSASCTVGASNMGPKPTASDRNTKENILQVGNHPLGLGLYLFDYKVEYRQQWGKGRRFGVIAQEVELLMPEAVCVHPDGYKMVNYAMLGITHTVH